MRLVAVFFVAACNLNSTLPLAPDAPTDGDAELDTPVEPPLDTATDSRLPDPIIQISAGQSAACGVRQSGRVACWGANDFGQLGVPPASIATTCTAFDRTAPCRATPTNVPGIDDAVAVAVGFFHACAVTQTGAVVCWGRNATGQLGHDPAGDALCSGQKCNSTPTQVAGLAGVVDVVVAADHSCARTTAGGVHCWGENANGTLGDGTTGVGKFTPVAVSGLGSNVSRIATAGFSHTTCAIKGGEVFCWGVAFGEGNLGKFSTTQCGSAACEPAPVKVAGIAGAFDLAVGERVVCTAISGGTVKCWGSNLFGQLGSASEPSGPQIRTIPGLTAVTALSGSMIVTCAKRQTGELRCWGASAHGGIGDGDFSGDSCTLSPCRPIPTTALLSIPVDSFSSGFSVLAIDTSGELSSWGQNGFGELGHAPGDTGDVTCGNGICRAVPGGVEVP